jgi:hypothetical protein
MTKNMITIYDHQIFHVNRSKTENEGDSLIYKDKNGVLHQIDFEICAKNYPDANRSTGGRCIGERNIEQGYFLLYTSGIQTKIVFKRFFVFPIQNCLLFGDRLTRFLKLQNLISESKYTTFDLT